jgi:hypothetical protein
VKYNLYELSFGMKARLPEATNYLKKRGLKNFDLKK